MNRPDEDRVLVGAVERGWLTSEQVARVDREISRDTISDAGRFGPRLEVLLRRGLLEEAALAGLMRELGIGGGDGDGDEEAAPGSLSLTSPGAAGDDPGEEIPGLSSWDRYRVERLLGAGGSGIVYLARDPRLDRRVAVKFLSRAGELGLDEARAQARVDHPSVCKVFEIGKLGARAYIAMEYVEGETLRAAAPKLTREEIAEVLRVAAEAVHAAHRLGLVHRDLKPQNILLAREESGALKPYVVDFGLAREMGTSGTTLTGSVLGTPAYMAPEQARGEVRRLDRRTDVYGLGATLYEALGGAPPFRGEGASVLLAVVHDEAPPLRRVDPSIPSDLETVVMKCLEKDPARRYDSALALAEDLDRYLRGEPVRARRAGPARRALRWSQRHRALTALSATALSAVLALGVGWARARAESMREAELARRFGEDAKEIESLMRLSQLAPLHDARADRARVAARVQAIDRAMEGRRGPSRAAGEYAAGRGLLALGRHEEARARLAAAQRLGGPSATVDLALAEALVALYQERLSVARRVSDPAARAARIAELHRELRDPARALLAGARAASAGSPAMVEGLIHFLDGKSAEALSRAEAASKESPWMHEAHKLMGDIHRHVGSEAQDRGDYGAAMASFGAASKAYAAARAIGRSDPTAYEADCTVRGWALEVEVESLTADVPAARFEEAIAVCDDAIRIDPSRPAAPEQKSMILQIQGVQIGDRGGDPRALVARAVEAAEQAVKVDPGRSFAHATLGLALRERARHETNAGLDPRASLDAAVAACDRAVALEPTLTMAHNTLGTAHRARADWDFRHGADPRPSLARAVRAYEQVALDRSFAGAHNNVGRAHTLAAEYEIEHDLDPRAALDLSATVLEQAVAKLPDNAVPHANLGYARLLRARYELHEGRDPRPALALAEEAYAQALRIGNSIHARRGLAEGRQRAAEYEIGAGLDARASIAEALSRFEVTLRDNPKLSAAHCGVAATWTLEARRLAALGEDDRPALARARAALERAAPSDDLEIPLARAELELRAAEGEIRRKSSPDQAIARGLAAAAEALRVDPGRRRARLAERALRALAAPR